MPKDTESRSWQNGYITNGYHPMMVQKADIVVLVVMLLLMKMYLIQMSFIKDFVEIAVQR